MVVIMSDLGLDDSRVFLTNDGLEKGETDDSNIFIDELELAFRKHNRKPTAATVQALRDKGVVPSPIDALRQNQFIVFGQIMVNAVLNSSIMPSLPD